MIEPLILESINYCKENEKPIPCNTKLDGKLISIEPFNDVSPLEIKINKIGKVRTKKDGNKILVNQILFNMFAEQAERLEKYYEKLQELYDNESKNYCGIIEDII